MEEKEMLPEYDFRGGVRGKYARTVPTAAAMTRQAIEELYEFYRSLPFPRNAYPKTDAEWKDLDMFVPSADMDVSSCVSAYLHTTVEQPWEEWRDDLLKHDLPILKRVADSLTEPDDVAYFQIIYTLGEVVLEKVRLGDYGQAENQESACP